MQVIDTIAKQYDNLLSANNELNNEFMNSCTRVQNNPMGNHEMEQKIDAETNQLNARLQQIPNEQVEIIEDMQKI
uniref:Uncharacterized protein n=1 Tax=Meloidogyne enterolobii TaxID=390850 RepID=A0A6V7VFT3_MELEN|nr:unnamed protein product [Meloidogyne enterolobii]